MLEAGYPIIFFLLFGAADTGYKMDVEAMAKNMNKSFADRVDHLLEFRNFQFTSAYTGHTADAPTTKWLDYHHDDKIPFSLDWLGCSIYVGVSEYALLPI